MNFRVVTATADRSLCGRRCGTFFKRTQKELKAEFAELKWEPSCFWNMQDRDEKINRLEQSIQWNEMYITHARNNILYHNQGAKR